MSDPTLTGDMALPTAKRQKRVAFGLTLVYCAGTQRAGAQHALSRARPTTLGRESTLFEGEALGDRRLSREHLVFEHRARRWRLTDPGSKNGTTVNGQAVTEHALDPGDVIRAGDTILVFSEVPLTEPARSDLVGVGPAMTDARDALDRVAPTAHTVLLLGETGTGKEVAARHVHARSRRRGPLVAVNCASLRGHLLESELFGHVKGAFTGADRDRDGLFRKADGGTLLLDEVGELPLEVQARLLRALQEKTIRPVGGTREIRVDTRVVAATNRPLEGAVQQGGFRSDLYARIARWIVTLPPLRARREDLGLLTRTLLDREDPDADVTVELMEALLAHDWPLNVRGLDNALIAARIAAPDRTTLDVCRAVTDVLARQGSLSESESSAPAPITPELLAEALTRHRGKVAAAARALGLSRQQLYRQLEQHDLKPSDFR